MSDGSTHSSKPRGSGGFSGMRYAKHHPPTDTQESFAGQTVLIIRATAGIGLEAAIKVVKLGASRVIIGARDVSRLVKLEDRLDLDMGGRDWRQICHLEAHHVDLSSPSSIQSFVHHLPDRRIDVAFVNAGLAAYRFQLTPGGYETSLQVEVLGKALCAILLLPKMSLDNSSLVLTGSEGYLDVTDDQVKDYESPSGLLAFYNKPANFSPTSQYLVSKLLVIFFQRGLSRHLRDIRQTFPRLVVASPGMTRTDLGRDFPWVIRWLQENTIYRFCARTAEEGSRALVSAAKMGSSGSDGFWYNDQLDPRESVMSQDLWDRAQPSEYKNIVSVLEKMCPEVETILGSK